MKGNSKKSFKSHLGLFNFNFLLNLKSVKLWVWTILHLILNTVIFILINIVYYKNSYFGTRLTWTIIGTIEISGYLFFNILNLIKIFKEDIKSGMNVIFLSKPFSRLTLYLNKITALFILCFCYGFIFFIYSVILSFFINSPFQIMIINISGFLLLTQMTIFFFITGLSLWVRVSSKNLIILFSFLIFLVFPLSAIVLPGTVGSPSDHGTGVIDNYGILADKDLNLYKQANYIFDKYGKDKIKNNLSDELEPFFKVNFSQSNETPKKDSQNSRNESQKVQTPYNSEKEWNSLSFHLLFTNWNDSNKIPEIIKSDSLKNSYENALIQVNKIKKDSNQYKTLLEKLDFYLDLLSFAINNETPVIEAIAKGAYHKNFDSFSSRSSEYDKSYTPLIFNYNEGKQQWADTNDFTTVAFNCFLTYTFTFYTKLINPYFIIKSIHNENEFNNFDINQQLKSRFVIPNYFNIFRQIEIMWQRPSLTKWNYEMKLKNYISYYLYNFFNNHDFIPYYEKDNEKRISYLNLEKSGYQFNMPVLYICYLLVGSGLIALSWLSYRKKDLV